MNRGLLSSGVLIALALAACLSTCADGVSQIIHYRSDLDDSLQAYGVYLPDTPPPSDAGYPMVMHGHGYGWSVSARFGSFQRNWAEERGWIIVNVNARGPNFYEGVGDIETLNVIADADARFGIDRSRVYFTGGSMGGSGALRHGLRHPDVFAAVMGVDGWTDYKLWHHHWYARKDQRDFIEEFRRPLLEAASPLYWAERGRWGATGHIVDGRDSVVLPENGLQLREALWKLGAADIYTHDQLVVYNPTLGHGRGTNHATAYGYFLTRSQTSGRGDFLVRTTVLPHGELYWGRIEDFRVDGLTGALEGHAEGPHVSVATSNLDAFTLLLDASDSRDEDAVDVWADGFLGYSGPPVAVTLRADRDSGGALIGWHRDEPALGLRKTPDLCGPVGEEFLRPFAVVWGASGDAADIARHRLEAEQFAKSWNAFMVHGPGIVAIPEGDLSDADLGTKTIVVFGTLDSSRLLRRDRVIVRDPLHGDRSYVGEQFGALMCYPNPLAGDRTCLVICNRRVFTQPDSQVPQLLGYDLEKLPWAYADYQIFNLDPAQLPFTLNVNNKPPVTCYEAGKFVEAGYFDDAWQIDRGLQMRRVRAYKPDPHLFAHIEQITLAGNAARVLIADSAGEPVALTRVTGRWRGDIERVTSTVTGEDGWCEFPAPVAAQGLRGFEVVNVMATGATYDWTADRSRGSAPALIPASLPPSVFPEDPLRISVAALAGDFAGTVTVRLTAPTGDVTPARVTLTMAAGERQEASFTWRPDGRRPGPCLLRAEAIAGTSTVSCPVLVQVLEPRDPKLALAEVKGADCDLGTPCSVAAKLSNYGCDEPVTATVRCAILEAREYPEAKTVTVAPGATATVTFTGAALDRGEYTARVSVDDARAVTGTSKFAVR